MFIKQVGALFDKVGEGALIKQVCVCGGGMELSLLLVNHC